MYKNSPLRFIEIFKILFGKVNIIIKYSPLWSSNNNITLGILKQHAEIL